MDNKKNDGLQQLNQSYAQLIQEDKKQICISITWVIAKHNVTKEVIKIRINFSFNCPHITVNTSVSDAVPKLWNGEVEKGSRMQEKI